MFRESDVLKALMRLHTSSPQIVEGVSNQDDGAVLRLPPACELCVTTDFVRGTGFSLHGLGHLSMHDLGRYLVVANVSDLAAMGAKPHCFVSVVRYSSRRTFDEVEELIIGIHEACEEFECPLVGGDSGSYESDVLSGTAIGILPTGRRLSRHTIQDGDSVLVSGEIGGAAAALAAATNGVNESQPEAFASVLERWRRPTPRIDLGQALVGLDCRVSSMDVSDGLTASLQQLSRITGLGFTVEADRLPISEDVILIAAGLGLDPIHLACSASVDFELLVTCAPASVKKVLAAAEQSKTRLTVIGTCIGTTEIEVKRADGTRYETTPGVPWDHQMSDVSRLFDAKV